MNSEVSHSCFTAPSTSGAEGLSTGAHGHRRYLSLGKEIAESGEERTVRAVVKGPREMTTDWKVGVGGETPKSLYDGEGFLKES